MHSLLLRSNSAGFTLYEINRTLPEGTAHVVATALLHHNSAQGIQQLLQLADGPTTYHKGLKLWIKWSPLSATSV